MSKRSNKKSAADKKKPTKVLAREQFPELNATLYDSDPATYLRYRLHTLVTMNRQLSSADTHPGPVQYGSIQMPHAFDFSVDEQKQALALESTMLVHHAGESLLRLYLAHAQGGQCPWMNVSQMNFRVVKPQMAEIARPDYEWPAGGLEKVMLGGATLEESAVEMEVGEWEESLLAMRLLLRYTADRVMSQGPLYNAAKHGLVGVPGEDSQYSSTVEDGTSIRMASGYGITYLSREWPDQEWVAATDIVSIESDFAVVQLMAVAIHNLWAVARRSYIGRAGHLYPITRGLVDQAFALAATSNANLIQSVRVSLHEKVDKSAPWGEGIGAATYQISLLDVGGGLAREDPGQSPQGPLAAKRLPLRTEDETPFTGSGRFLFSFSPPWASAT